jgi:phage FluMu protein Com
MLSDCNNPSSGMDPKDIRCLCGQLMAIKTESGIEIKCRRCKQITLIPSHDIEDRSQKI